MRKAIIIVALLLIPIQCFSADYFVDNIASGANDGSSWSDAWESFGDISWGSLGGGDTLYISGGTSGQTYSSTLDINASGASTSSRLMIKPGAAHPTLSANHDGLVTIDPTSGYGIDFNSVSYVTVTGYHSGYSTYGDEKIRITGTTLHGVYAYQAINVKLLYCSLYECGDGDNDDGVRFDSCTDGSEIGYCEVNRAYQDGIKFPGPGAPSAYGAIVIHHNWVHGNNDDMMAGNGGADIHHNIIGPWGIYGATGHPDGIQAYSGYLRIYDNTFQAIDVYPGGSNALLFLNYAFGDSGQTMDHVRVSNNIFYVDDGNYGAANAHFYGVEIAAQGGATYEDMDDIIICNNTFCDVGYTPISVSSEASGAFTNFIIKNNIIYNCKHSGGTGVMVFSGFSADNSSITVDNNLINGGDIGQTGYAWLGSTYTETQFDSLSTAGLVGSSRTTVTTAPSFVLYSANGGSDNDYHLASILSSPVDAGENLSGLSDMHTDWPNDKDGISRPQCSFWDIGAYEYLCGNIQGCTISGGVSTQ